MKGFRFFRSFPLHPLSTEVLLYIKKTSIIFYTLKRPLLYSTCSCNPTTIYRMKLYNIQSTEIVTERSRKVSFSHRLVIFQSCFIQLTKWQRASCCYCKMNEIKNLSLEAIKFSQFLD